MKKRFRLMGLLCVLLSFAVLLCACGGGDPTDPVTDPFDPSDPSGPSDPTDPPSTKVTYTVKVVDQNGNPLEGIKVQFCTDKGCMFPIPKTNAEGIATGTYESADFHVTVENVEYNFPKGENTLTITLTKE